MRSDGLVPQGSGIRERGSAKETQNPRFQISNRKTRSRETRCLREAVLRGTRRERRCDTRARVLGRWRPIATSEKLRREGAKSAKRAKNAEDAERARRLRCKRPAAGGTRVTRNDRGAYY